VAHYSLLYSFAYNILFHRPDIPLSMRYLSIQRLTPSSLGICVIILLIVLLLALFSDITFPLLSQERASIAHGEWWRLLTSHLVHFGWAHTLMNMAAFAIFAFAFAQEFSPLRFVALVLFCCAAVGAGIYFLNPEYEVYAGLSGVIHGFFIAGLLLNKRHSLWLNGLFVAALFGKILMEQLPGYQTTELQALLPVAVAYDAHLYGAIAGLIFGASHLLVDTYLRQQPKRDG
jgi:rhomboid family GlyGly-CTERM serine protease